MTSENAGARRSPSAGFDLAPLLVGASTRTLADAYRQTHYKALVDAVMPEGAPHHFAGEDRDGVSVASATDEPRRVRALVAEALGAALARDRLCVLDLTGLSMFRGVAQAEAAAAVGDACAADPRPLLIVADAYPPPEDPFGLVAALDNVTTVSADGRTSTLGGEVSDDVKAAITALLEADPLEALRQKLVRVPGYFPVHYGDGATDYARSWYDGRFCEDEVEALLIKTINENRPDALVLCPAQSTWMTEPARAAGNRTDVPVWTLDEARARATASAADGTELTLALVAPMVRSGTTVAAAWTALSALDGVAEVRATALLSTAGRLLEQGRRHISAAGVSVDYWVRVEHDTTDADDGRVGATADSLGAGPLSVHEFWDLVGLCGTRDEDNVPAYRGTLGEVPDTRKMLDEYGPWLAARLKGLARATRENVGDVVLATPDEPVSRVLAGLLSRLFGMPAVAVLRDPWLLGQPQDPVALRALVTGSQDVWARQLRRMPGATVVLVDEFVSTGGSLDRLRDVVEAAGLRRPTAALTLIDLRPSAGRSGPLRVSALYDLPQPGPSAS